MVNTYIQAQIYRNITASPEVPAPASREYILTIKETSQRDYSDTSKPGHSTCSADLSGSSNPKGSQLSL